MSDIAIRVENLSKLYRIGTAGRPRYETLYDKIAGAGGRLLDRLRRPLVTHSAIHIPQSEIGNPQSDYIWALKDVSFEVKRGEVVGIIGRNGAGKSTLLKILSRITEPTEGRAYVYGRVGSLLEVGTGFHPELTGRENIYLNGAILGMRKAEIDRKFDEIVAFAEIEKFIDTPVKFYSSGMYVRLAFAVAAHLDPEILLVDEVLAVGDAAFQKKCLGKMGEVAGEGRTVLFVSHNMAAIRQWTQWSLWIHDGHIRECGSSHSVVNRYLKEQLSKVNEDCRENDWARMSTCLSSEIMTTFGSMKLTVRVTAYRDIFGASIFCRISADDGALLTTFSTKDDGLIFDLKPGALLILQWECGEICLGPGRYQLAVFLDNRSGEPLASCVQEFDVSNTMLAPRYNRGFSRTGYCVLRGQWTGEILYSQD
jgi:ABC-type polysaccharide/polyol phosphate transport system ATPase subunit